MIVEEATESAVLEGSGVVGELIKECLRTVKKDCFHKNEKNGLSKVTIQSHKDTTIDGI